MNALISWRKVPRRASYFEPMLHEVPRRFGRARALLVRASRRSRACLVRLLLVGMRDPTGMQAYASVRGVFGFVMGPPRARDIFDAIRVSLATRIGTRRP